MIGLWIYLSGVLAALILCIIDTKIVHKQVTLRDINIAFWVSFFSWIVVIAGIIFIVSERIDWDKKVF